MSIPSPAVQCTGSVEATAFCASPLFREEVMSARHAQWLGSIRIAHPLSFTVITASSLAVAAALVAFALFGEVTRKTTLHGVLLPIGGLINVAAPQAGLVAKALVDEGDEVQAGQQLIRLRTDRISSQGDVAQLTTQALADRRTSLDTERRLTQQNLQQRTEALAAREQSLRTEQRQALAELETHRLRLQLGQKSLERQQQLAISGFVAAAQVQQKQEEMLDLQLRERNAERNLQALQRDLQAVRADQEDLKNQTRTVLAQLDRSLAMLNQEFAEADGRNGLTVTAPHAGRVSALTLGVGQPVQGGQTLLSLVPMAGDRVAELQAQLFAPSRTVGFIHVGQRVWLRYSAYPYQKFGLALGEVVAVSRSPIAAQDLPPGHAQALLAAAQINEPLYRVTVRPGSQSVLTYGKPTPLTVGMTLDADVQQDTRKVWEWLLEPAFAVLGKR